MFAARFGLRNAARFAPRAASVGRPFRQAPRLQQRFASYQRFPGKGGPGGKTNIPYSNFAPYARLQYVWRNYQTVLLVIGGAGGAFYVVNLEEVPVTGRRRFNIISPETEKSMLADAGYQQVMQEYRGHILPREHPYTQLVARIVERLLPSAHGLGGDEWKVHVVDDPNMVNAFVLPGGKVFVFTGLLPIAKDENGLAAVLGHEIGHNIAHHMAERLSRQGFTIVFALLASYVLDISGQMGNALIDLIMTLPNGRTQETEADHIGLLMMAESCYDPEKVPDLWARMAEAEKKRGGAPPQFLSTHPSSSNRGAVIRQWMPEAMAKYAESSCAERGQQLDQFRQISNMGGTKKVGLPGISGQSGSRDDDDWPF